MIKNHLNKFFGRKNKVKGEAEEECQPDKYQLNDMQAYQLLQRFFDSSKWFPITSYSIRPSVLLHAINEIILNDYKEIIEFGTGLSTIVLSAFFKEFSPGITFLSVDESKEWQNFIKNTYFIDAKTCNVEFIWAPVAKVNSKYRLNECNEWYSEKKLEVLGNKKFDLVLIDGPSTSNNKYARSSAIPWLLAKSKLAETYSIFLDDTYRKAENTILAQWGKLLQMEPDKFLGYSVISNQIKYRTAPIYVGYSYKASMAKKSMNEKTEK